MSFFEQTPTGRILNLFSRDIYVVDAVLARVSVTPGLDLVLHAEHFLGHSKRCSNLLCYIDDCGRDWVQFPSFRKFQVCSVVNIPEVHPRRIVDRCTATRLVLPPCHDVSFNTFR